MAKIIEIPSSEKIIGELSHSSLRDAIGYGHNASLESLRNLALSVIARGNQDFARDLRTVYLAEKSRL